MEKLIGYHYKDGDEKDRSPPGCKSAHGWVVWIVVNIYWDNCFELGSWSRLLANRAVKEYIDIFLGRNEQQ